MVGTGFAVAAGSRLPFRSAATCHDVHGLHLVCMSSCSKCETEHWPAINIVKNQNTLFQIINGKFGLMREFVGKVESLKVLVKV